jgi:CheY-like chemotaxis protein
MHDLTASKEIEDNLRIAKNKAVEANLAKTEFLANMSHEIRTPLNGVMGMLQLVQMTDLDSEQKNFIDTGISSAKSLLRILADILDLSKIESGKLDIESEPFQLEESFLPVVESFSQEIARKQLDFTYKIYPEVPETVVGDQVRIRQILYNLLGNAIKFTEKGFVNLEIYLLNRTSEQNEVYIHFVITDSGIGIKDEDMVYIFDSFTQADGSHTRRFGGTGLGLSMVKRLIRLMNGSMVFSSEQGVGTEVHVTLKLGLIEMPDEKLSEAKVEIKEPVSNEANSILLVEDEKINQIAISKLLEKNGYEVTCADNGEEALKVILKKQFDFVLMDIQMPVLNGIQTTVAIRTSPEFKEVSGIPVIALTAHAMRGDREKFIQSGMNEYLPKPVDAEKLITLLKNYPVRKRD